ncbi:hypothetical protein N7535_005042 [Penicillium sp. DV-2018c]|nr:hypothetical protein N7461_008622 [Penicillium sp. DV-2018c]KAJ5571382.1 hypothetical protein N7535_005042 [Penicillium sp. DV-2018c]
MAHDFTSKPFRDVVRGLLVHPFRWTPRHLDMLGCRFEDAPTISVFPDAPKDQRKCPERPDDAEMLDRSLDPDMKHHFLENILLYPKSSEPRYDLRSTRKKILADKELKFHSPEEGAPFYFRGRQVHQPEYTVFHRHGGLFPNIKFGLVGHLNYVSVIDARTRQLQPRPGAAISPASLNYYGKQLAQVTPKQWTEDPYFLCVLLALAQMEKRKLYGSLKPATYTVCASRAQWGDQSIGPQLNHFQPRLLVTGAVGCHHIYLYETEITRELLDGLSDPDHATQPLRCSIRRKTIAYKPYDSFASRLITELNTSHALDNDVNRATEHKKERQGEPEDRGSRKRRRF